MGNKFIPTEFKMWCRFCGEHFVKTCMFPEAPVVNDFHITKRLKDRDKNAESTTKPEIRCPRCGNSAAHEDW
jgi:hypothetical protein